MTRALYKHDHRVSAIAGGARNWMHNPEACEVDKVDVSGGALRVKASAGGASRGIAIRISIELSYILELLPRMLEGALKSAEAELARRRRHEEYQATRLRDFVRALPVESLGLRASLTRALVDAGISTVGGLEALESSVLRGLEGVGPHSFMLVQDALEGCGLGRRG